uniref:Prickle-like protein 2 n=1 Tax=Cacopsylla melanoneura TaxID=428564 RepID=A0A8D8WBB8_9HEMI
MPSQAVLDLKLRFPGDPEEEGVGESGVRTSSSYPKREYTFDWIPPNVSSELAAEYMQQFPANKLPISGSDGALYRRQQLEKQVPLHDLNSNLCHNLTTDEVKALTDYLENLKQNVVGQGMIMKLPSLLPSENSPLSSLPPASSNMPTSYSADAISSLYNTVPKPFKLGGGDSSATQDEPEFPPPPPELLEDIHSTPASGSHAFLKPPSAFIKKSRTPSPTAFHQQSANLAHHNIEPSTPGDNIRAAQNPTQLTSHHNPNHITSEDPHQIQDNQDNPATATDEDENKNVKVSDFIRSLNSKQQTRPGGTSGTRSDNITSTNENRQGCQKPSDHGQHNLNINENNVDNLRTSPVFNTKPYVPTTSSLKIESFNQLNEPVHAPNKMIAKHLDSHQNMGYNSNLLGDPRDDNVSQSVRVTNLDDLVEDLARVNMNEANGQAIQDARNGNRMQDGNTQCGNYATKVPSGKSCKQCTLPIHAGELAIFTEKLGENILWHPTCFVCSTCNELLVDLMYFHYKSNVYCLRDYAQMLDIPRCHACDELIFVNEYTLAENKTFHVKHFCCYQCDKELCNQSYIPVTPLNQDNVGSHPYCLDCYYANFSKMCAACNQVIDVKDKCIQFNDKYYWHIKTECFACTQCKKYLNNEKFMMQFEKPFCSRPCVLDYSEHQR